MSDTKRASSSSSIEKGDVSIGRQLSDIETRDPHDLPPLAKSTQWKIVRRRRRRRRLPV